MRSFRGLVWGLSRHTMGFCFPLVSPRGKASMCEWIGIAGCGRGRRYDMLVARVIAPLSFIEPKRHASRWGRIGHWSLASWEGGLTRLSCEFISCVSVRKTRVICCHEEKLPNAQTNQAANQTEPNHSDYCMHLECTQFSNHYTASSAVPFRVAIAESTEFVNLTKRSAAVSGSG